MAKAKMLLGLTAACVACCAIPFALPVLLAASAGLGLAGIGAVFSGWWLTAAGLMLVALAAVAILRRCQRATSCEGAGP